MTKASRRSPGEGRVEQLPDDRYRAVLRHEYRTRKGPAQSTKAQALRDLDALKRRRDEGRWHIDTPATVAALLVQWMDAKTDLAYNTDRLYRHMIAYHLTPRLGGVKLAALAPQHIQQAYAAMRRDNVGASTMRYCHMILRSALRYAEDRRMIDWNPAKIIDAPAYATPEKRTLTREQLLRLFRDTEGTRYHALWVVMGTAGLRPSEARALRWADIDWEQGRQHIAEQIQYRPGTGYVYTSLKTAASDRFVVLSRYALDALQAHHAIQERERLQCPTWQEKGLIFTTSRGTPLDAPAINRAFKRDCLRQSIDGVTPHSLRHTFITLLLEDMTPATHVQRWAGHADTRITLDTYGHMSPDRLTDMARRMDAILTAPESEPDPISTPESPGEHPEHTTESEIPA